MLPYLLLILAIVLNVAFAQIFRFAQLRGRNAVVVAAVNYVVASLACMCIFLPQVDYSQPPATQAVVLGTVNGLLYITHLIVILAAFQLAGAGITTAVVGAHVIFPVVIAWLLWPDNQQMHAGRWAALALVPIAIFLMRPPKTEDRSLTLKADVALFFCFAIAGVIGTVHTMASQMAVDSDQAVYRVTLFTVAAVASMAYAMSCGFRPKRNDITPGIAAGSANVALLWLFIEALEHLEAGIVFPTMASVGIILNFVVAIALWRERPRRKQYIGAATAVVVVILATVRLGALQ